MQLNPTALHKVLLMCVTGKAASAQGYVATMIARDADMAPLRAQIEAECAADFLEPVRAALPWLADEKFMPREAKMTSAMRTTEARDVRSMLDVARWRGVPKADLTAVEIESLGDDAAEVAVPTGGRPKVMIRLKEHDIRFNVWARPGDY